MLTQSRLTSAVVLGMLAATGLLPLAVAGSFNVPAKPVQLPQQTGEPPVPGPQLVPPPPPFQGQPRMPVPVVPVPGLPPTAILPPAFGTPPPGAPVPALPPTAILPPAFGTPLPVDPPAPLVKIQVRVSACIPEGQVIEYKICIKNCSRAPAHHVMVRNPLPVNACFVRANPEPVARAPELLWDFGTLLPGCIGEICLVLAATDNCDVLNCARVQFEHGQCVVTRIARAAPTIIGPPPIIPKGPPPIIPREQPLIIPKEPPPIIPKESPPIIPQEPPKVIPMEPAIQPKEPPQVIVPSDVKLGVKITGPAQQYANLPVKYHITVTNAGQTAAPNVLIAAFLPEKSDFVGASDQGRFHYQTAAWLIGDLPAGASRTVQVVYKVPAAGEYCLKAAAMPERGPRGENLFCTNFQGVSALLLEVVDTEDPVQVGGQTSYKIILFNQGTAPLTNVQVKALVPPELMAVRATGPTDPGSKLPPPTPEGQPVVYQPLNELKPGERQVYEVFVQAVKAGDARFRVMLTADQLQMGGPVIEEESTQVFSDN